MASRCLLQYLSVMKYTPTINPNETYLDELVIIVVVIIVVVVVIVIIIIVVVVVVVQHYW